MSIKDSDQSQNQGFHVNQPRIDSQHPTAQPKNQKKEKTFQPRFISGYGMIKKEPKEAYQMNQDIPNKDNQFNYLTHEHNKNSFKEDGLPSAAELYLSPQEFAMVYSRSKQPFGAEYRGSFNNQISLKCCEHYRDDTFKVLREFDQKSLLEETFPDNHLVLDSRFESGNLQSAFRHRTNSNCYTLFMQNDTNTYGYNQWFYFSIRNAKKNTKYTFRIANYRKSYSFFKLGMKPMLFSLKRAKETGNGWYRDGQDISYYRSNFKQSGCTPYYTLQFSLQFEHQNDYITISPSLPYSYSKLMKTISNLQAKATQNHLTWRLKSISPSLTNTQIPYISLTSSGKNLNTKQSIVIIARQHSGETWSSFLVEEIMQELVQQRSEFSKWFTENYVVRIFPMVNVDGVIYGNFRCDLAGYDLNRTWKDTIRLVQPQVAAIKEELQRLSDKNGILFCLDLHTHSKQFGAFAYCCVQSEKGRQLPSLLSKITPIFRYPACTFGIASEKETTARASVFNLTKNINTITIQLSACGFKSKGSKYPHTFSPLYMRNIAQSLLYGYHCYSLRKEPQPLQIILREDKSLASLQQPPMLAEAEDGDSPVMGSDSEPEMDEIDIKVRIDKIFPQAFIEDIISHTKKNKKIIKKFKKNTQPIPPARPIHQQKISSKKTRFSPQPKENTKSNKTQSKPLSFLSTDSIQDKTIVLTPSPKQKKKKLDFNSDQPLYKKPHKLTAERSLKVQVQRPTKPLNLIEFSLKKLPIVPPDKIQPNMNYFMDESFPMVGISYAQKEQNKFDKTFSTYEAICRPRVRANSRKVGLMKQKNHRLQQQLPYLCVMSQNKRLLHFQHIKDRIIEEQATQIRTFHNSILNGHKQKAIAGKLKNSQKYQNGELASRITDQFARYDEIINAKKYK